MHELKAYVEYELKTSETMNNRDFWKFVGNPMYRMLERSVLDNFRDSEEYQKKLFERIDSLINEIRPYKALFEKREKERKGIQEKVLPRPNRSLNHHLMKSAYSFVSNYQVK